MLLIIISKIPKCEIIFLSFLYSKEEIKGQNLKTSKVNELKTQIEPSCSFLSERPKEIKFFPNFLSCWVLERVIDVAMELGFIHNHQGGDVVPFRPQNMNLSLRICL